jgi:outer membrane protein TolC
VGEEHPDRYSDANLSDIVRNKHPLTTNPTPDELTFIKALEDRNVAARLQRLTTQGDSGVLIPGTSFAGKPGETEAVPARVITLEESFKLSQRSGREFLSAQEEYLLSAIGLLVERHQWGPRFFNDTSASVAASGNDGDFFPALSVVNTLRATRRLPFGGSVEASWVWNATEQLREEASEGYQSSSSIVLSGNLPLLRGAGNVARESLIQAERNLVYQARTFERFRRTYLVDIANDYFSLIQTKQSIANQERQIKSLEQFVRATQARVDAGRLDSFQTSIAENQLASATSSLASLRESYLLSLERFKVRLGVALDEVIDVTEQELTIPEPDVVEAKAAEVALDLRLDLQNARDQLEDTRRGVANARDNLLPDLDVNGRVTIPTDPDNNNPGLSFSEGDVSYSLGATLSLPLDKRVERLNLRAAQIGLERSTRDYDRQRDDIIVGARSAARNVELARFQLNLAEAQVESNKRRLRAQKLQEDLLEPQQIVDAENDLLNAENARDQSRTNLRNAVLNYLLQTDQLRVNRDGTLRMLPGMEGG